MDDDDADLFEKKDLRKRKDKKRSHKQAKEMDECTKEGFKKMKEEIDELRKREMDRTKELEELKKKIEERPEQQSQQEPVYALQFDRELYINKGFIESAKWIKEVTAKNMLLRMSNDENKARFESMLISKKASTHIGMRTCARFNRGEICHFGRWHSTHKPDAPWHSTPDQASTSRQTTYREHRTGQVEQREDLRQNIQKKNEIRMHVCTLCMEVLGSAVGHSVLNCPWILEKNWK
jgi:hypothetical protein